MRRFITWLIFFGFLAGGGYYGWQHLRQWMDHRGKIEYLTATVSKGRLVTVVNSTGTIKPVQSVSVGAFTSGPVSKVYVDFNSPVNKGDVLAEIDPRLLQATVDHDRAAVESQRADLNRIEALLQQAKNNEKRSRNLMAVSKDYISETDLDQFHFTRVSYEAQIKLAQATIKQVEANLKNSEANLGYTKIVSPVDGIVIERKVDPGQTVAASFQTPELFVIAPDMDKHMFVFASVDEADIGQIRKAQNRGSMVNFKVDAYPGETFVGKIHQVRRNPTTTQNVVTYPVVIEVANPELKLLPGMTANLTFQIEVRDEVLRIPTAAIRFVPLPKQVRLEDRHYLEKQASTSASSTTKNNDQKQQPPTNRRQRLVWIKVGDLLHAVPVRLGLMENQHVELLEGNLLDAQEVVIGIDTNTSAR